MTDERVTSAELQPLPKSEFVDKLERLWKKGNFVCVGLDSDYTQIPDTVKNRGFVSPVLASMLAFNCEIVDATHDLVCAYKPNSAFYEAQGTAGLTALAETVRYIKEHYPEIPIILDAKRADIGNTNSGYVQAAFDELGVDAITVHPYLGKEALQPFLDRKDKGIIVLAKTSNPGAGEFQDKRLLLQREELQETLNGPVRQLGRDSSFWDPTMPLYQYIAHRVANHWNINGNCGLVVGATYPRELTEVRAIVGTMPILIPGIGAQGGEVEATVAAGKDNRGMGMIVNASRSIIFASKETDFAQAARKATEQLRDTINRYR